MVKGKLILISQSGGKLLANDDGSMSYTGGEAHAVEINHETSFDDLKLKLAELWNLQSKTLSIKYFLPGNRKTLICISNDRHLKRMKEFYLDSITADLFISGEEGFDQESLNMNTRRNDIIVAEAVTPANPSKTKPKTVRKQIASSTSANRSPNHAVTNNHGAACSDPPCSVDMDASPAGAVKKRRRAASRAVTANGPTEESEKVMSWKKNKKNHGGVAADNGECQLYFPSMTILTIYLMLDLI